MTTSDVVSYQIILVTAQFFLFLVQEQSIVISASVCYSVPDRAAEYCDDHVCLSACLSVCLPASISSERHVRSSSNCLCVTHGRC